MTPQEVGLLLRQNGRDASPSHAGDSSEASDVARPKRTELLAGVLGTCEHLRSTDSEQLDLVAEKLADGSRDVSWRLPYGDSGILDFFIALLSQGPLGPKLHIHALRLIGNSCADTDENRARVVDKEQLLAIIPHLKNESLIPFHIPVIYNILVDYDPAQILASKSGFSKELVTILSLPNISEYAVFVPYICKILALLVSQQGEPAVADPDTVGVLLGLAAQPVAKADVECFISLLGVAVAYLACEDFQTRLVSDNQVPLFLDAFHHLHAGLDIKDVGDDDLIAQIKKLRSSLLSTLADISGHDSFIKTYPLSDIVPQSLVVWARSNNPFLQAAACLALGNISRSDEASLALVESCKVHEPLVKLLADPAVTDGQLLHAACSFLKNLAIPPRNKPRLGDLLRLPCVPRLYSLDTTPQVQFAAVSLTRLLLLNCPPNARELCTPVELTAPHTGVGDIISLFGRSDAESTKLEAARCVAGICRILHSTPISEVLTQSYSTTGAFETMSDEDRRTDFYRRHPVHDALRFLITQDKWPSLRSEAWFILALMSRSKDGARIVLSILKDRVADGTLIETVTGQKPESMQTGTGSDHVSGHAADLTGTLPLETQQTDPKQRAPPLSKADGENALVLCTELLKVAESEMTPERSAMLQDLIKQGTRRIAANQAIADP
ncbi:uncharacterized protein UV8b_00791 [Ustilaginoidea virens]|uniref:Uncharacterized protein n=1 Tax=Ustilaginoidea virens TaxID=1159556 RepID=A0A063BVA8_USTVR|nr:uncharacterized protein UV8b_00791 [Ustilaginoidea virens]QUC16550.1 hypothetical protein UV8b_00791 [Ustilaginoidea virens]GAO16646.1 hypothetical protein UVI_02012660 [Ustilaginoidea virens]